MWFKLTLIVHVLSATIWTGGHLFIAIVLLPKAIKNKQTTDLFAFERNYERIGMPALLVQVVTGLYLAYMHLPQISKWFDGSDFMARHILIKLTLLLITVICAVVANKVLIPNSDKKGYFNVLSVFIYIVTLCSVLFVVTGVDFRLGMF